MRFNNKNKKKTQVIVGISAILIGRIKMNNQSPSWNSRKGNPCLYPYVCWGLIDSTVVTQTSHFVKETKLTFLTLYWEGREFLRTGKEILYCVQSIPFITFVAQMKMKEAECCLNQMNISLEMSLIWKVNSHFTSLSQ